MDIEAIASKIVNASVKVHKALGPGLLESVYQKCLAYELENEGLEKLECVGKAFDPNMHEILAQIPTKDHQNGTVLEEARKGFMFKGKVLRPSVVKIACNTSEGEENE